MCGYALAKRTYASVLKPRMRRMTTWTGGVSARSPSSPLLDIPRKVQKGTACLKGRGGDSTPEPASGYSGRKNGIRLFLSRFCPVSKLQKPFLHERQKLGWGRTKTGRKETPTCWLFSALHGFQLGKQADEPLKGFLVSIDPNKVYLEERKNRESLYSYCLILETVRSYNGNVMNNPFI